MDIVCRITGPSVVINVQGTRDDPLFQAVQIGAALGLANVNELIHDFEDDEVQAKNDIFYLTLHGVHRLLSELRESNPIAWPLQKWMIKIIKDVQLNLI